MSPYKRSILSKINNSSRKITEQLPDIPEKQYFSIGEVSILCKVKPHVLRYWESEFSQLKPTKRKGNRRYYKIKEVLLIRKIRTLLYNEGYTINGAKTRLHGELSFNKNQQSHLTMAVSKSDKNLLDPFANSNFFSDNELDDDISRKLLEILDILQGSQDSC